MATRTKLQTRRPKRLARTAKPSAKGRKAAAAPARGRPLGNTPAGKWADKDVAQLGRYLKAHVRALGGRARAVSLTLGKGKDYLSRAFGGKNPLKMKHIFGLFAALGEHPRPFFNRLYTLGSGALTFKEREQLRALTPDAPRFEDLVTLGLARDTVPTPEAGLERARRLLKRLIIEKETDQRRVSVSLGLNPGTLGQALNGGMDLEAWHVFGVLRVLNADPGAYFRELLGPTDEAVGSVSLEQLVPALQQLLGGTAAPLRVALADAVARAKGEVVSENQPAAHHGHLGRAQPSHRGSSR